jgi:hypothetical protein
MWAVSELQQMEVCVLQPWIAFGETCVEYDNFGIIYFIERVQIAIASLR